MKIFESLYHKYIWASLIHVHFMLIKLSYRNINNLQKYIQKYKTWNTSKVFWHIQEHKRLFYIKLLACLSIIHIYSAKKIRKMNLIVCDERSKRIKNCEFTVLKRKHALLEFIAPIVASEPGVKVTQGSHHFAQSFDIVWF